MKLPLVTLIVVSAIIFMVVRITQMYPLQDTTVASPRFVVVESQTIGKRECLVMQDTHTGLVYLSFDGGLIEIPDTSTVISF